MKRIPTTPIITVTTPFSRVTLQAHDSLLPISKDLSQMII